MDKPSVFFAFLYIYSPLDRRLKYVVPAKNDIFNSIFASFKSNSLLSKSIYPRLYLNTHKCPLLFASSNNSLA